ncbi:MAG: LysR family transcriptional regulator [Pseudomonadota bacterium]
MSGNLRRLDLNLLVVFDVLATERSVTRTAQRLGMSQPAVSHALGRLRTMFDDQLFVRGSGGLQPTPRAIQLSGDVAAVLSDVKEIVTTTQPFDAATSTRRFTVRASDLLCELALPELMATLRTEAPGISIAIMHSSPDDTQAGLRDGAIDIALSFGIKEEEGIVGSDLVEDHMVVFARRDHPHMPVESLEALLALPHLKVAIQPSDRRFLDEVLAARGLTRQVVLTVPHWLTVPPVIAGSDLVTVLPHRFAAKILTDRHAIHPLPFPHGPFVWRMYESIRRRHDHGLFWLKGQIRAAFQASTIPTL